MKHKQKQVNLMMNTSTDGFFQTLNSEFVFSLVEEVSSQGQLFNTFFVRLLLLSLRDSNAALKVRRQLQSKNHFFF